MKFAKNVNKDVKLNKKSKNFNLLKRLKFNNKKIVGDETSLFNERIRFGNKNKKNSYPKSKKKRYNEVSVIKHKNNDFSKEIKETKIFFHTMFNKFFYVFLGVILTFVVFFILTGRKNFFKLYYELKEFIDVYDVVTSEYYSDFDKDSIVSSAIDSMLSDIGDSYTTYVDKGATDTFLENVNGTYEGIGCKVATDFDGNIVVVEVFEDSPSSEAGLAVNDIILKVNDEDFTGKTSLEISDYIKNNKVDKIILNVKREEKILDINIKREKIDIPVVDSRIIEHSEKKIGYVSIDIFSSVSYIQIKNKLKTLEKDGISGIIIDVRNNNGGYLSAANDISSLFLKKGKVIYQLKDNNGIKKVRDLTKEYRDYPVVVLVNSSSASASEIFAAAIKESYGGFVVGTNTFGKGTVQKTKLLKDGSMIKYTVQNWLTPKGNFINEVGLTPTNIVELDYNLGYDNQLQEAIEIIANN